MDKFKCKCRICDSYNCGIDMIKTKNTDDCGYPISIVIESVIQCRNCWNKEVIGKEIIRI